MKDLGPLVVTILSGGLITGIVGIVGLFVSLRNTQRELQSQRETEDSRAQQDALQKYFDQISDLVLNQDLHTSLRSGPEDSKSKSYVRGLAQARTMAILAGIGPSFKRLVLTMVYEQDLIDTDTPLLELRNAALAGANLSELTLRRAYLKGVDLRGADLHGADLEGTDLTLADLRGADLSHADLSRVNLTFANLLPYDEQDSARWSLHSLGKSIDLNTEDFRPRKQLVGTKLREAILNEAQLCDAWLGGADLRGAKVRNADLTGAQLKGANLNYADLEGAKGITTEELEREAHSLEGATMPNGQKYEDWFKNREKRQQDG
jgi:uncharacterized protein YjbI with pentapeptide repeats